MEEDSISPATIRSLADKLDGLDLDGAEAQALAVLLERASLADEPEVAGFGMDFAQPTAAREKASKVQWEQGEYSPTGLKLVVGLGLGRH